MRPVFSPPEGGRVGWSRHQPHPVPDQHGGEPEQPGQQDPGAGLVRAPQAGHLHRPGAPRAWRPEGDRDLVEHRTDAADAPRPLADQGDRQPAGSMHEPASDGAARSAGEVTSHWGRNRASWSPMVRSNTEFVVGPDKVARLVPALRQRRTHPPSHRGVPEHDEGICRHVLPKKTKRLFSCGIVVRARHRSCEQAHLTRASFRDPAAFEFPHGRVGFGRHGWAVATHCSNRVRRSGAGVGRPAPANARRTASSYTAAGSSTQTRW